MREAAAGGDEVTAMMLREGGAELTEDIIILVRHLWGCKAERWGEKARRAVGILLYKGKGSTLDLGNYMMITLISTIHLEGDSEDSDSEDSSIRRGEGYTVR